MTGIRRSTGVGPLRGIGKRDTRNGLARASFRHVTEGKGVDLGPRIGCAARQGRPLAIGLARHAGRSSSLERDRTPQTCGRDRAARQSKIVHLLSKTGNRGRGRRSDPPSRWKPFRGPNPAHRSLSWPPVVLNRCCRHLHEASTGRAFCGALTRRLSTGQAGAPKSGSIER